MRVLVTGGAKGVGAAIVRTLAARGFDVDFTYRLSHDAASSLQVELASSGCRIRSHQVDLADRSAVDGFCEAIADDGFFGLVHNAGAAYDTLAALMDQDRAESLMQVNFWSFTRLVKTVLRSMLRARSGRIVAIGSIAAIRGNAGNAAYAASKGALLSYCRSLAVELAPRHVTANYIAPGFVDTDMLAPYQSFRSQLEAQIPVGRFGAVEEVAALAGFLFEPAAAFMTGTVLPIDGGLSATLGLRS